MRGLFATGLLALLALPAAATDYATGIMYHRFGENGIPSTNIRLEQLDEHIRELKNGAYTVLPLADLVAGMQAGTLPDRAVAITVDDAYLSFFTEGWPRFKAAGLPVTLFVASEPVDSKVRGYMTWEQLRQVQREGVVIGHHSHRHPNMPLLSPAQVQEEITTAFARFKAELGVTPSLFAYPFGEWTAAVRDAVKGAGFAAGFGQHSGVMYAAHDRFTLPRVPFNEKFGDLKRLRQALNALPLYVRDVAPADPVLRRDQLPTLAFTVTDEPKRLKDIVCFSTIAEEKLRINRNGARFEISQAKPFTPGYARISCTVPEAEGRFRWFGYQYYITR